MNINEFIEERKGEWERLEAIAEKLRPGRLTGPGLDEIWELGKLYNAAVSDLSLLRSSEPALGADSQVLAYLNALVIRVHGMIYRTRPFKWSSVWWFLAQGFPSTVRRTVGYVALSTSLFGLFGILGFVLGLKEPGFMELLVPESILVKVEEGKVWFSHLQTMAPMASSWLMTHNISVTFLVIASGITFGVGTVYLMSLNGLLLGTVAAACYKHGLSGEFWSFVLPHGSLELSAICIAGGAGLILGHALLDPGPYRRSEFLAVRGKEAGKLALGCIPLLILAGVIEAFFSPAPLPHEIKFAFAGASFLSLVTYLCVSGKTKDRAPWKVFTSSAGIRRERASSSLTRATESRESWGYSLGRQM